MTLPKTIAKLFGCHSQNVEELMEDAASRYQERKKKELSDGIMNRVYAGDVIYLNEDPYVIEEITLYSDGDDIYIIKPLYKKTTVCIARNGSSSSKGRFSLNPLRLTE